MGRVSFTNGQVIGKAQIVQFNVEKYKSEVQCQCGVVFTRANSVINRSKNPSCGNCPTFWILGQTFGKWTVTKHLQDVTGSNGASMWEVLCECGTVTQKDSYNLRKGNTTHCGCSSTGKVKDITGNVSGKLTALDYTGSKSGNGDALWNFSCSCGGLVTTTIGRFNSGHTKSCGCLKRDSAKNRDDYHGMKDTNTYNSWRKMRERCNNPKDIMYLKYGGEGITVCKAWDKSFSSFHEDMGDCPEGFTIDRIDTLGNYEQGNCRWGSKYIQNRNRNSYTGTSRWKGVQYEKSSGKWLATMSIGELRSKKVGRYLSEDIAGKAYNLASELIFGEGNPYLHLNDLDRDYTEVNLNCKFFKYWVPVMRTEYLKLYEQEED